MRWATKSLPSSFGLTKSVIPIFIAKFFRTGLISTPIICSAPTIRAPWITLRPIPPKPNTTTLAPGVTFAV